MIKKLYWFLFEYDLNESLVKPTSGTGESLKKKLIKDLSYVVLFSYTFFIFSPLVPLISDIAAHTFWEKEHLLTEHKLHGKNHVGQEISKSEKNTSSNSVKSGVEDYSHIQVVNVVLSFSIDHSSDQSYSLFNCSYPASYPDTDYPPPKV
ncbi:hypothetical protein SAMN05518672_102549 [Chitinophaga sp. CF118]|uniref:hypothetical protein n=1 Tax=Chitinophaga sp. CF118 TaxID=1884367 RepID=UPI0008F26715|nr:hypothetical protein [Chitinophaga sp. CF118]SFD59747.1 hypothetical protein SAMN05518672_102549 [Chitinophaga sp. CF118]